MTSMPLTDCLHASKSLLKMSLNLAMPSKNFLKIASAHTAEEFRAELARDAFITGLDSSTICQRLLEKDIIVSVCWNKCACPRASS